MKLESIRTELHKGVLVLTIDRQEKLNALNNQVIEELHNVLAMAAQDRDVAGIIITGAGEKAFVAGADIAGFKGLSVQQARQLAGHGQAHVFDLIDNMCKPVVAAINGFALGGGLELALACHVRLASDNAKMGLPEVTLGLIPGYGGTQRLAQIAGKGRAMELILSGEFITADEAWRIGVINKVTTPDALLGEAKKMIGRFVKNPPEALAAAIDAINGAFGKKGYQKEVENFAACFATANAREGISAFTEKRKPAFNR